MLPLDTPPALAGRPWSSTWSCAPCWMGRTSSSATIGQWGGVVQAVEVVGTTGYLAQGPSLVVMDLSDPANPQELGRAILPDLAQT